VTHKKYNSDNCIALMIIIFLLSSWSLEVPSGKVNPKLWGQMFDFRQTTALLFGTPLLKAQKDKIC